jgi:hypothetical protein
MRTDVYQKITDQIVAALEQGVSLGSSRGTPSKSQLALFELKHDRRPGHRTHRCRTLPRTDVVRVGERARRSLITALG